MSNWYTVGRDEEKDPRWRFSDPDWCLEPLQNGTCESVVGVASIAYSPPTNPLCSVPTCDRLAPDTKVLDIYVTDRRNTLVEVTQVYEDELAKEGGIFLDIPRTNDTRHPLEGSTVPTRHRYLTYFKHNSLYNTL